MRCFSLRLLFIIGTLFVWVFLFAQQAYATTYTIGPEGDADFANFVALRAYFRTNPVDIQAGDIIDGRGNSFTETWFLTSDFMIQGAEPITLKNATITGATSKIYNSNNIGNLVLSNITISNSSADALYLGTGSDITVDDCHFDSVQSGILGSGSGVTISSSSFESITGTNNYAAIWFTGGSDIAIRDVTASGSAGGGINLTATASVSLTNVQVTGATESGIAITGLTSGTLALTDIFSGITRDGVAAGNQKAGLYVHDNGSITLHADGIHSSYNENSDSGNGEDRGFLIADSDLASGSYLQNFHIDYNDDDGIIASGAPNLLIASGSANYNSIGVTIMGATSTNVIVDHVTMNHNRGDGYNSADGDSGTIIRYSESSYNGELATLAAGSGDGFSFHENSSASIYYSKAIQNLNTAMAHVDLSTGSLYNITAYGNGTASGDRASFYLTTTADPGFTVRNTINASGTPFDLEFRGGTNDLDYNLYHPLDDANFETFGSDPISWSTYHTASESHSQNADPLFRSVSGTDFSLQSLSPAIDAGTDVGQTTDFAGNRIYGTPDIGAYEYQPPYTIGTDLLDPSGSIRIYNDGKYRYTAASSSYATADFSVTPEGGFPGSDYSAFLDVTLTGWSTTGGESKAWTASSSTAGNTTYTIGDLLPLTQYQFLLDGNASDATSGSDCSGSYCTADASGKITFTYTGGYSSHTFALSYLDPDRNDGGTGEITYASTPTPSPNVTPTPTPTPSPSATPTVPPSPSTHNLKEGSLIGAQSSSDPDIYVLNDWGYKRLFLNPVIFSFYGHLGSYANVIDISPGVRDIFPTSTLVRNCETNDPKAYALVSTGEDTGELEWVNVSGNQAVAEDPAFFKKVFCINSREFNWYSVASSSFSAVADIPEYRR